MEISGIRAAFPFMFQGTEKEAVSKIGSGDIVDVRMPEVLSDEEAEKVFNESLDMISQNPAAALSVHSGLSESRVFALVGA